MTPPPEWDLHPRLDRGTRQTAQPVPFPMVERNLPPGLMSRELTQIVDKTIFFIQDYQGPTQRPWPPATHGRPSGAPASVPS